VVIRRPITVSEILLHTGRLHNVLGRHCCATVKYQIVRQRAQQNERSVGGRTYMPRTISCWQRPYTINHAPVYQARFEPRGRWRMTGVQRVALASQQDIIPL